MAKKNKAKSLKYLINKKLILSLSFLVAVALAVFLLLPKPQTAEVNLVSNDKPKSVDEMLPQDIAPIGVNKFNLFWYYTGFFDTPVSRTSARAAMAEMEAQGIQVVRVFIRGEGAEDVGYWEKRKPRFREKFRQLVEDAAAHNIKLVPVLVNPSAFSSYLGRDPQETVRDTSSPGFKLMRDYLRNIIPQHQNNDTILFWEIANELQNHVRSGDYTEAQYINFMRETAQIIQNLDPTHAISSGSSVHYKESVRGVDELNAWYKKMHPDPIGIVSTHLYPAHISENYGGFTVDQILNAMKQTGKIGFIGEIGDYENDGDGTRVSWSQNPAMLKAVLDNYNKYNIRYIALWSWHPDFDHPKSAPQQKRMGISPQRNTHILDLIRQYNNN